MRRHLDIVSRNYPYLVAECDREVVGYAYASPYRLRPAYRHTAENSVYLHSAWTGRGVGRQLRSTLLAECEASKRTAANRGRHRRQRELRLDPSS